MITGDVVSGYAWDHITRPWTANHYKKLDEVFMKHGSFFATTAGNHDTDGDLNRMEVAEVDRALNYSLTLQN